MADDWQKLLVIGAGGHGSEVLSYVSDLAEQGQRVQLISFVDENKPRGPWLETEVIGTLDDLNSLVNSHPESSYLYITAIGNNHLRRDVVGKLESLGVRNLSAWTLRHSQALVGRKNEIGEGTCLAPGSVITTNVRIGGHCIINVKASVSHDSEIGSFSNINPGAVIAGNVRVGEGCYIGAGATVIEKISIGEWSIIGAGAVVTRDIPPHVTAVGVPAKIIKIHAETDNRVGP